MSGQRFAFRIFQSLIVFLICSENSRTQTQFTPCAVAIRVYSPSGNLLPFKIIQVTPTRGHVGNLLTAKNANVALSDNDLTILFPSNRILTREIEVLLQDERKRTLTTRFIVNSCPLRRSLFAGASPIIADTTGFAVSGQLKGCNFDGDWWVRALPMFGGQDKLFVVDGYVSPSGKFSLALVYGVRHLIIIGKGKKPIKVLGVDVSTDQPIDAGLIDISNQCPLE